MEKCKHPDCIYRSLSTNSCDYVIITGTRRPCPPGTCKGVYRSIRSSGSKKGPPRSFDEETALKLYLSGCSDKEIAEAVGSGRSVICHWRNRRKLVLLYGAPESVTT